MLATTGPTRRSSAPDASVETGNRPGPKSSVPRDGQVSTPEVLVPATDREQRGPVRHQVDELAPEALELAGHGFLLAILAAADEDEVGRRQPSGADADPFDARRDRPSLGAADEGHDVAAVAVDPKHVREQVDDPQP